MAQITDIKDRFETIVTSITDINTFSFDVFSSLNTNRTKTYPVFLLKVPERSQIPNSNLDWKFYDIEFYLLDLHPQADTRTRSEVWDELQVMAEQVLIELRTTPSVYRIKDKAVEFEYGYDVLNDKCVVVKGKLTLGAFHCYTAFTPTGTYTYEMVMALTYEQLQLLTYDQLAV